LWRPGGSTSGAGNGRKTVRQTDNLALLAQKGSLFITRPTLQTYGAKREAVVAMAKELFDVVQSGVVKININQTYPLKDVSKAHRDLEARKTTGSTVLTI
jgi:NADPH2:quinone reductase